MTDLGNLASISSITNSRADGLTGAAIPAEQQAEMAQQFESMFTSLLLKEMRQSTGEDGLFEGDSSDTLGGMFDMFLGEHIAKEGGLGIAKMVETYLENAT